MDNYNTMKARKDAILARAQTDNEVFKAGVREGAKAAASLLGAVDNLVQRAEVGESVSKAALKLHGLLDS